MDLLNEQRSLIHTGRLLRQPEAGWDSWGELFVLLFDNYCECCIVEFPCYGSQASEVVMTKPKEKDGVTKYIVNRRVSGVIENSTISITRILANSIGLAHVSQLQRSTSSQDDWTTT